MPCARGACLSFMHQSKESEDTQASAHCKFFYILLCFPVSKSILGSSYNEIKKKIFSNHKIKLDCRQEIGMKIDVLNIVQRGITYSSVFCPA